MDRAPTASAAPYYDRRTIALHWISAALVLALWALGQTIDAFPKGEPRIAARSTHIAAGTVLALVLAYRFWWRLGGGARPAPAGSGRLEQIALWTHRLLYLLLFAAVLLGLANAWVRGDTLFNWFRIPAYDPGNKDLRETVEELHELAANTLLIVALLHAAAALAHHYLMKDDVLRRMLPRLRPH